MTKGLRSLLASLFARIKPDGNTAKKTLMSGIWTGLMNSTDRALQLLMIIILANLLNPVEFGIMGIALLILSALRKFSNLGFNSALIQKEDENVDAYLNTAWVFQIARGVTVASVLVVIAPLASSIFGQPRATPVLRVIAISPLLLGFRNPGIVYFRKKLDFHKQFLYRISGSVTQFCIAVGYAIVEPTIWALVYGFVIGDFVRFVVSYASHDYRPRPLFRFDHARELIGYGKWITGSSIVIFLYSEGDDAVVGWLLGATSLAFYQNAYRLSNAPATEITQVVASVMFPALSTLQDSTEKLREAYFRMFQVTMLLSFPMAFGIAAVAPVFVTTFMGEEWAPMIAVMQILSIYGLFRSIGKTTGPVFRAIGRPDYETKLGVLRLILTAVLIIPAVQLYGIEGAGLVVVGIGLFPMIPLDTYLLIDTLNASYRRFVSEMIYPLIASVVMFGVVFELNRQLTLRGPLEFAVLVLAGATTYASMVSLFAISFDWNIEQNLQAMVSDLLGN